MVYLASNNSSKKVEVLEPEGIRFLLIVSLITKPENKKLWKENVENPEFYKGMNNIMRSWLNMSDEELKKLHSSLPMVVS